MQEDRLVNTVFWLQHVPHETLGTIEPVLVAAGLQPRAVELFRELPEKLPWDEAAGLIVMGGPMNVDQIEEFPFLAAERTWIRQAVDGQLPVLGICLGSQLIARTLRAEVAANPVKEIGWYPVEMQAAAAADPLLAGCPARPTVFQWHGDTFALPEGAVPLARSRWCENQAYRVGDRVYGFQFHLEVTAKMIDAWLDVPENRVEVDGLEGIDPAEIRRSAPRHLPGMHDMGLDVFRRFAELCCREGKRRG